MKYSKIDAIMAERRCKTCMWHRDRDNDNVMVYCAFFNSLVYGGSIACGHFIKDDDVF